ncbi:MAG: hypothetical protein AABW82_05000 [Nanoarchaeota archaeon]
MTLYLKREIPLKISERKRLVGVLKGYGFKPVDKNPLVPFYTNGNDLVSVSWNGVEIDMAESKDGRRLSLANELFTLLEMSSFQYRGRDRNGVLEGTHINLEPVHAAKR